MYSQKMQETCASRAVFCGFRKLKLFLGFSICCVLGGDTQSIVVLARFLGSSDGAFSSPSGTSSSSSETSVYSPETSSRGSVTPNASAKGKADESDKCVCDVAAKKTFLANTSLPKCKCKEGFKCSANHRQKTDDDTAKTRRSTDYGTCVPSKSGQTSEDDDESSMSPGLIVAVGFAVILMPALLWDSARFHHFSDRSAIETLNKAAKDFKIENHEPLDPHKFDDNARNVHVPALVKKLTEHATKRAELESFKFRKIKGACKRLYPDPQDRQEKFQELFPKIEPQGGVTYCIVDALFR